MPHPISDPHGEGVGHADETQDKEDVDRLEEIAKELQNLLIMNHYHYLVILT
jgi:hypothetical protein